VKTTLVIRRAKHAKYNYDYKCTNVTKYARSSLRNKGRGRSEGVRPTKSMRDQCKVVICRDPGAAGQEYLPNSHTGQKPYTRRTTCALLLCIMSGYQNTPCRQHVFTSVSLLARGYGWMFIKFRNEIDYTREKS